MTKRACLLFASMLVGCGGPAEPASPQSGNAEARATAAAAEAPGTTSAEPTTAIVSATPSSEPTAMPSSEASIPGEVEYPFHGLEKIPDDCKEPSVVLTTAPTKEGWDYDWIWTRQAMYANQQFKLVDWPSKADKAMQVRLDMYEIPGGFALLGVCKDGETCNKLAAMYKATVPTCNPKLHCGEVPMKGPPRRSKLIPETGAWLPASDDVIGQCARIGVCLKMKKQAVGNPGVECQSSPKKFRVDCASKATCGDVVQCLNKP
ncbi:MAG: hypothetical protein HOW73_04330 [Polyangiaceae bacterium]|nr:hypothetical protein [Polyangiaceae bacterium]